MCIVAKNSTKSVKSDYFGVKPYSQIHLVRKIPKIWDIPQVLLLVSGFGDKDSEKIGIFHKFYWYFHQNNQFSTGFSKYLGNFTYCTDKSKQIQKSLWQTSEKPGIAKYSLLYFTHSVYSLISCGSM